MRYTADQEKSLMTELLDPQIAESPLNFVLFNYPWGKENTVLHNRKGPRHWQMDDLLEIEDHINANKWRMKEGRDPKMFKKSTVSGRGVGKSAEVAWITNWQLSCHLGSTTQITANTEEQLKTKTMAEVGKWLTLGQNAHWFDRNTMSIFPAKWFGDLCKDDLKIDTGYYYARAMLWSEENPDAFAGTHNPLGMLLLFDEASGIPRPIWTVSAGYFTEPDMHRYWMVFSNGRRNDGEFYSTHEGINPWERTRQLDSRTVEDIDQSVLNQIIDDNGADSDEARVEVYGQFPDSSDNQFIPHSLIKEATDRDVAHDDGAALILGVDIARGGKAKSVARFRKGRDAKSIPQVTWKKLSNIELGDKIAELIDYYDPDAVNIDAGQGSGVIDYLREILGYKVNEVWFAGKAREPQRWGNKRIEMYDDVKKWLPTGSIDASAVLKRDLGSLMKYQPEKRDVWFLLAKKFEGDLDESDALALTFALKVARRDKRLAKKRKARVIPGVNYSIFGSR